MDYTIGRAVKTDGKEIQRLYQECSKESYYLVRTAHEYYRSVENEESSIELKISNPNILQLVAEKNGQLIGILTMGREELYRQNHKAGFSMCVAKSHWGKGVGKSLLKEALIWADEQSIKRVEITVVKENSRAIKLYENLGFEIEGILKLEHKIDENTYLDSVVMGRVK